MSYLSSGKSSAMAMSLRPMSFHESRTTLDGLSGGLMAASFFMASCAWMGRVSVAASRAAARNGFSMSDPPRCGRHCTWQKSKASTTGALGFTEENLRDAGGAPGPHASVTASEGLLGFIRLLDGVGFVGFDDYVDLGAGLEADGFSLGGDHVVFDADLAIQMVGAFDGDLSFFRFTWDPGLNDFFDGPGKSCTWLFGVRHTGENPLRYILQCIRA